MLFLLKILFSLLLPSIKWELWLMKLRSFVWLLLLAILFQLNVFKIIVLFWCVHLWPRSILNLSITSHWTIWWFISHRIVSWISTLIRLFLSKLIFFLSFLPIISSTSLISIQRSSKWQLHWIRAFKISFIKCFQLVWS